MQTLAQRLRACNDEKHTRTEIAAKCVLDAATEIENLQSIVAEMVAYFDVIENKFGGAAVIDISADWPSDWLCRARKALPPSEDPSSNAP